MKVALLGDTHLGYGKSSDVFHSHFRKFFDFFFKTLEEQEIKTIFQTGDLYDIRKEVQFTTLYYSREYFFSKLEEHEILMYCIAGNHDAVYKNTNIINSVSLLKTDNMVVVDVYPKTISIDGKTIDLYPWINQENKDVSLELARDSTSNYAIGHFEFDKFPMYPGSMANSGMNHSIFENYERVFSGHYHTISEKGNVHYLGTPYEMTWGDCDDPKGFYIMETDTGATEFIRNPYTLFEKISYTDAIKYDFPRVSDKYIKLVVADKKDQKKFDKFVDNINLNNPIDLKIIESSITESVADAVENTAIVVSTQNMIEGVVDSIDTNLDKEKLKQYVVSTYAEAISLSKL